MAFPDETQPAPALVKAEDTPNEPTASQAFVGQTLPPAIASQPPLEETSESTPLSLVGQTPSSAADALVRPAPTFTEPPTEAEPALELIPEPLQESFSPEELLPEESSAPSPLEDTQLKAVLEAIIYVTDEPLSLDQICAAIEQPRDRVIDLLEQLAADYEHPSRGLSIREVAGGFKMTTKPEHHDAVRRFVKNLNPPLKLSLAALETLAVIAYKQPITAPEILEIRGVQGASVLKTLIDRKLITTAGRKQVVGKPILYKTTREFLVQFGLKDLGELPSLKEFEELARLDTEAPADQELPQPEHVGQTPSSSFLDQSPDAPAPLLDDAEPPQPTEESTPGQAT